MSHDTCHSRVDEVVGHDVEGNEIHEVKRYFKELGLETHTYTVPQKANLRNIEGNKYMRNETMVKADKLVIEMQNAYFLSKDLKEAIVKAMSQLCDQELRWEYNRSTYTFSIYCIDRVKKCKRIAEKVFPLIRAVSIAISSARCGGTIEL